ncbi:hypothetical protein LJ207_11835 [Halanaerobium sp. Z-7514]|uniref:DUF4829 domain-containing protein n=1 Tax=Halanaerobium polyolivorans TaxID=2886943 RepID=A0AAW4X2H2_9FIRM|nr:hypothetical protein [Halanaerobium polyolivorans]MCC3146005.1 hypothetical protein [Halanaerobium polyolivorans]
MKKKIIIISIFILCFSFILNGCSGGGSNSVDKEQVRTEVGNFINNMATSEESPEAEIDKIQENISSEAHISVIENGNITYLTKEEYIDLTATFYSDGYKVISYSLDNMLITVNSSTKATANFRFSQTIANPDNEIYTEELVKTVVEKQAGNWIIIEYVSTIKEYQEYLL